MYLEYINKKMHQTHDKTVTSWINVMGNLRGYWDPLFILINCADI